MKVKLEIELDLPESCEGMSPAELQQLLFDEYVNYATVCHCRDVTRWMVQKSKEEAEYGRASAELIVALHKTWSEICGKAQMEYKVL